MRTVKPNKDNHPCFLFVPVEQIGKAEEIYTDKCMRCFAGILLMERKPDGNPERPPYGAYVWHINPGRKRFIRSIMKHLFARVIFLSKDYNFTRLVRCGGMMDSSQNAYRYRYMCRKFEQPFKHLFPHLEIVGERPDEHTVHMSLLLKENFDVNYLHEKRELDQELDELL